MGCPTVTASQSKSLASLSTISSNSSMHLSNLLPTVVETHCITPTGSLKRPRSVHEAVDDQFDSFDMVSMFQATLPVDKSMEFPKIERDFDVPKGAVDTTVVDTPKIGAVDTTPVDTPESGASCTVPPPRKRRCVGMVRSRRIESGLNNLALLTPLQDEVSLPCERASSPTTCQELHFKEHQAQLEPRFLPLTEDLVYNDTEPLSF